MKQRENFKRKLTEYYKHLLDRLDKGASYVDANSGKGMVLYESIIDELQRVEMLMLYYGLDRSDL